MVFSISNIRWSFGHVLRTPRMGLCQGYFKTCIFSQIWGTSTKDIFTTVRQHVQNHYRKVHTSLGPLQNSNINPPYHHLIIFFISQKSKKSLLTTFLIKEILHTVAVIRRFWSLWSTTKVSILHDF